MGWRHLMNHYKDQILACDMFTVETVWLQTIYVLFFIELGSRRVHFAGITTHPHQIWTTQQARQLVWDLVDEGGSFRFLIHDNDSSFYNAFDAVFISEGYHVIHTPFRAPNANGYASYCTSFVPSGMNSESGKRRRSASFWPWSLVGASGPGGSNRQLFLAL